MRTSTGTNFKDEKVNRILHLYTSSFGPNRTFSARKDKLSWENLNNTKSKNGINSIPLINNQTSVINRVNSARKTVMDKEALYEECIHLKSTINTLNRELHFYKSETHKLDLEMKRQAKMFEEITINSNNNVVENMAEHTPFVSKIKENNLIQALKKQYKDLKKEFNFKDLELEELKKINKTTKINELKLENQILLDEMKKMKEGYENYTKVSLLFEKLHKDYIILQENFNKQEMKVQHLIEDSKTNGTYRDDFDSNINNKSNSYYKNKFNSHFSKNSKTKNLIIELELKNKRISELEKELRKYNPKLVSGINLTNVNESFNFTNEEQFKDYTYILKKNFDVKFDNNRIKEVFFK